MEKTSSKKKLNKIMTESEAVSNFLKDGDTFTSGGFLMSRGTESVFREIARQNQQHLSYIDETGGFGLDLLIGKGVIDRIDLSFLQTQMGGSVTATSDFRRSLKTGSPRPVAISCQPDSRDMAEKNAVKVVDWTMLMITMRFVAGAMKVPFMPVRTAMGSDIVNFNEDTKVINDPFKNQSTLLVPAANPDVAFITVHRADQRGNGQIFGHHGNDDWKAKAAKHVVLFTEELVTTEQIRERPANTVIPSYCTDAVVVSPFSSHPFGVFGKYETDYLHFNSSIVQCLEPEGRSAWINKWVYNCKNHFEYCEKIGWENLNVLAKREQKVNPLNI